MPQSVRRDRPRTAGFQLTAPVLPRPNQRVQMTIGCHQGWLGLYGNIAGPKPSRDTKGQAADPAGRFF